MTSILSLEECREQLNARYSELAAQHPLHFARFNPKVAPSDQVVRLSAAVTDLTGLPCPSGLAELAQRWDLGGLDLAGFNFGRGPFGAHVLELNRASNADRWWEDHTPDRPTAILMVAQSDPHVLLVDVRDDAVMAFDVEAGSGSKVKVADDVSLLVRAAVTLHLADRAVLQSVDVKAFTRQVGSECNSDFWLAQRDRWLYVASTAKPERVFPK